MLRAGADFSSPGQRKGSKGFAEVAPGDQIMCGPLCDRIMYRPFRRTGHMPFLEAMVQALSLRLLPTAASCSDGLEPGTVCCVFFCRTMCYCFVAPVMLVDCQLELWFRSLSSAPVIHTRQ
ncbi:hypothetical protein CSUI_008012 [Cystoisospora suis]|uniref:Uncharacterized protein n=1 Tax=Cystoisospora suis TaxID=483139 RepID=A0A2C6KP53_9APIC|nr:hypothetical protein CSUI_008012 [Cystoisospora suis]